MAEQIILGELVLKTFLAVRVTSSDILTKAEDKSKILFFLIPFISYTSFHKRIILFLFFMYLKLESIPLKCGKALNARFIVFIFIYINC